MARWRVYAKQEPWLDDVSLYIFHDGPQGHLGFVKEMVLERHEDGQLAENPSMKLPFGEAHEFLQGMANAAWEMGIKPTALEDQRNELKATRYHLEDMRKLAKVDR